MKWLELMYTRGGTKNPVSLGFAHLVREGEGHPGAVQKDLGEQQGGRALKRAKRVQGMNKTSDVELLDLLEEVSETNWLLHQLRQSVEGFYNEVCRIACGMERVELIQELDDLVDNQGACFESSAEDSESTGSWRTGLEEMEQSSEEWRVLLELELELSDMEESEKTGEQGEWDGKEEVEKEVEGAEEETMS